MHRLGQTSNCQLTKLGNRLPSVQKETAQWNQVAEWTTSADHWQMIFSPIRVIVDAIVPMKDFLLILHDLSKLNFVLAFSLLRWPISRRTLAASIRGVFERMEHAVAAFLPRLRARSKTQEHDFLVLGPKSSFKRENRMKPPQDLVCCARSSPAQFRELWTRYSMQLCSKKFFSSSLNSLFYVTKGLSSINAE